MCVVQQCSVGYTLTKLAAPSRRSTRIMQVREPRRAVTRSTTRACSVAPVAPSQMISACGQRAAHTVQVIFKPTYGASIAPAGAIGRQQHWTQGHGMTAPYCRWRERGTSAVICGRRWPCNIGISMSHFAVHSTAALDDALLQVRTTRSLAHDSVVRYIAVYSLYSPMTGAATYPTSLPCTQCLSTLPTHVMVGVQLVTARRPSVWAGREALQGVHAGVAEPMVKVNLSQRWSKPNLDS